MPMKEQQPDGWRVPCSRYEGRPWLYREVILTPEGIGAKLAVYPATIVQARYNGSYEGAPWLCFPVPPGQLMEPYWLGWDGDEIECQGFWRAAGVQGRLIGRGASPTAAYDNLIDQACARVGVDRAALTQEPA
jgi:hypothetical protein